eukprot:Platyproteum_vivax@DN1624_c0_g1_i3.p1
MRGSLIETLKRVQPTFFFGVPRVFEKFQTHLMSLDLDVSQDEMANDETKSKCQKALGFDRIINNTYSGAAPMRTDTLNFFYNMGVNVKELYGMAELSAMGTFSRGWHPKICITGPPTAGCEVKIDHNPSRDQPGEGEVCFRHRSVMMGYLNCPEMTEQTIDAEGWLHSGDSGSVDETGCVKLTGRLKEIIVTAGGENVAPIPVESSIKGLLPQVSHVVMVGDLKPYNILLVAMVTEVEQGRSTIRLAGPSLKFPEMTAKTTVESAKDPAVLKILLDAVKSYNKSASTNPHKIRKIVILPTDFVPGDELTVTMKLKRNVVHRKYSKQIESAFV